MVGQDRSGCGFGSESKREDEEQGKSESERVAWETRRHFLLFFSPMMFCPCVPLEVVRFIRACMRRVQ